MTSVDEWLELTEGLNVWRRGSQRAVNKPLLTLMLIARADLGLENELSFEELCNPLAALLREFGPPRASVHPEYPFWHLQSDGFWVVRDADRLPFKRGGSSPTKGTLLENEAVGYVKESLWRELRGRVSLRRDLARRLLADFWPESLHQSILKAVGLDLARETRERSRRDPTFRDRVMVAYERRCAVCGFDARLSGDDLGLEAAHIRWHCYAGPDTVANGILLCSLHHVTLDRGGLGIADDLTVCVSKHVSGGPACEDWLGRHHGRALLAPRDPADRPARDYVAWHRAEVFRHPPRA